MTFRVCVLPTLVFCCPWLSPCCLPCAAVRLCRTMGVKLIECRFTSPGSLGLTLVKNSAGHATVKQLEGQAKALNIQKGDNIVSVGLRNVQNESLNNVLRILKSSRKRPLTIVVSRIVHGLGASAASWSSTSKVVEVVRAADVPPPPPPKNAKGVYRQISRNSSASSLPPQRSGGYRSNSVSAAPTSWSKGRKQQRSRQSSVASRVAKYNNAPSSSSSSSSSYTSSSSSSSSISSSPFFKSKPTRSAKPIKTWSASKSTSASWKKPSHSSNFSPTATNATIDTSSNATAGLRSTNHATPYYSVTNTTTKTKRSSGSFNNIYRKQVAAVEQNHSTAAPKKNMVQYRALYDFVGEASDELDFKEGDIIQLIAKIDANWYNGRFRGREGIFPSDYVERVASRRTSWVNNDA